MAFIKSIVPVFFLLFIGGNLFAQKGNTKKQDSLRISADSTILKKTKKERLHFISIDTSKPYNPRIAIARSAVLPGWGQITNKKYWKLPLVYGALGTTGYIFFRNIKQFRGANAAYKNAIDGDTSNNNLIPEPYHSVISSPDRIKTFRNQVRQNVDYSVLFFIAFWGLNVVDAAVDAHLKTFDVSDELSLQIKPGHSSLANTNGISLVLDIHSKNLKKVK
ncbi:MAG: DUF5683 domain-containing protein [Ferruginibacter sp.]